MDPEVPIRHASVCQDFRSRRWFRHYWVLAELLLIVATIIVLLLQMEGIGSVATVAAETALSSADLRALKPQSGPTPRAALWYCSCSWRFRSTSQRRDPVRVAQAARAARTSVLELDPGRRRATISIIPMGKHGEIR